VLRRLTAAVCGLWAVWLALGVSAAGPASVEITWMSISNMYYRLGALGIVTDGYITRLPEKAFHGGGGGLGQTDTPFKPNVAAVARVMESLGGAQQVTHLLTGHSHFDHSFDTATWSRLSGAPIIGSQTTCLQAQAEGLPPARCRTVVGSERIALADGVTLHVIRWNHSGDAARNPEQHNPVELTAVPKRDPATDGLRAGVAEDFPNGGGGRAFLFVVDGPQGRLSWFYNNSGSAVDLRDPIVVDGKNFGAPLENLRAAMREAGLEAVDLWIGSGGAPIAELVLPVLRPRAYLPVHWDGLWAPFEAGLPKPYADAPLEAMMAARQVRVVKPTQYMDKWRLDKEGVHAVPNSAAKRALGFAEVQAFR
jgi:L-ascorbate metabolism protein UlaG (beta-lactamase superfamily)